MIPQPYRDNFRARQLATSVALPKNIRETTRIPLGTYRGMRFGIVLHSQFPPDVYLEGATTLATTLSREHQGPRAVLNALERLASGYGSDCERIRQDLAIAENQLRDYQARLGKPFTFETYLSELTGLRDQLKAGLSSAGHGPDESEGPSVSEMAERVKALKAANSIEVTPQRDRQKHSTAEEPITARIRRRKEAIPASESTMAVEAASEAGAAPPQEPSQSSPTKPQITFQERIILERQSKNNGQSPS